MSYARKEFMDRGLRVFAPSKAQNGAVAAAIDKCADTLKINWHRARDLLRGRVTPKIEEMDVVRELDGVWCNRMKRAKAAVEDKIEDIWEFVTELKRKRIERKRASKPVSERLYDRA